MADLLGSILGSMEKPPSLGDAERKKAQEQRKQMEKMRQQEKERLNVFRSKIQQKINDFIKDPVKEKLKFDPMDKVFRSIVHEVADVAGLTSFSFGQDEVDRYIMVWKKEFAPSDDELSVYRRGEEWNPEKAKELVQLREQEKLAKEQAASEKPKKIVPATNYQEKYEKFIGKDTGKDSAIATTTNRSYGFVPSENKRDLRTIEQVMADNRAKKKQKTEHNTELENATETPESNETS